MPDFRLHLYSWFCFVIYEWSQYLQRKETKRTATTAVPPLAAAAERGRGGAETETDAAEIGAGTVKSADTDAG